MKIPSYDDLTPSIADVHPRDTFDFAARLVPGCDEPVVRLRQDFGGQVPHRQDFGGQPVRGDIRVSDVTSTPLFACLRTMAAIPGALIALARDFSPRVERYGEQCVVLDVSGLGRLLGDAPGIALELARTARDRGVSVEMAIAPTQTAARLLTLHADAPRVVTSAADAALADVPLSVLATFRSSERAVHEATRATSEAVDLKIFDTLRRWGLRTIGEFAALPADEIAARFGQQGIALQRFACGIDLRPLVPDPGIPRFIETMELEWPIEELEPLSFVLARLLDPLSAALERADRGAAAVRLDLRLVDRATHSRLLQLPAAMRDPRVLRSLLLLDLESHPPSAGIDVVAIEADPAPARIVQFSLLERAIPSPETLATLTARLNALVGEERCGSPILLATHRPDAFEMGRFEPGPAFQGVSRGSRRLQGGPTGSNGCQEVLGSAISLRRFRPPVAIRVALDRGRPVHVSIDRKGMPGGEIVQAAGPWRTSGEWWDACGRHWDRDEWDVEFVDGAVCRVYYDRDSGHWFMEGVVD